MPANLSKQPYRVGRSRTGLGLFATKPIKKGAKIARYFGPLLDSRKKKHKGIENKYLFELSRRWTIDGSVRENIARYINHACKPNAESDVKPRKRKVVIRAIKNIEPGEEINYDYGTDYFKAYLKPIGCKCVACEKKRKKKRAKARAERLRLKAKAERRAQKKAEKLAKAKAEEKAKKKKLKLAHASGKLEAANLTGKQSTRKRVGGKRLSGRHLNRKHLNAKRLNSKRLSARHSGTRPFKGGGPKAAPGKILAATSVISETPEEMQAVSGLLHIDSAVAPPPEGLGKNAAAATPGQGEIDALARRPREGVG